MSVLVLLTASLSIATVIQCDYTVTIYPEILHIGQLTNFDHGRWNGKNGLDSAGSIPHIKQAGTYAARWLNRDLAGGLFQKATEDPHKKGYPDPAYFQSHQHEITDKYVSNIQGYGNTEVVMELKGVYWPHWMDTSMHNGQFPNNIDAAAEFVYLLIQAVDKGSNGKLPIFFEVINEPGGYWKTTNWTTIVTFHQAVAQKIKSKYPHMRVGGPTLSGASANFDRSDFKVWKKLAQFLDMALTHMDFFSFHSYAFMDISGGSHMFHRNSEAKVFGLLDLIDSYAHKKTGKSIDVIVSEFGLSRIVGVDVNKPNALLDWGYIYQHNSHLFTFLERRDIMRKVVAFLVTYSDLKGQDSINYSILDKHHNERDIAQAFKFWMNFSNTLTYLRVDSQFHGAERKIVPHVLVDKSTGALTILLHNHDKKPTYVKLDFAKGWFNPRSGNSTCEYLNPQKRPVLEANKFVQISNSGVTVPAEASCYFQFHTTHNFAHTSTLTQTTYYSKDLVIAIHNSVDVKVQIPVLGKIEFARLRVGVSLTDLSAIPKPKTVQMNKHSLTSFYSLHTQNAPGDGTVWQSYEYNIPTNVLVQHSNDVKLTFNQSGGYVSTIAVIVGRH